ncbi:MAG: protein-L-isoaspartate(D-aspartate) O-methyltransferase [Pseudomonadales bacterium]
MKRLDLTGSGMTSQRTRDRLVARLRDKGIHNEDVLAAIARVPRHIFVDEALAHRAYEDTALPIGYGQTISQPFIVALMTQALLVAPRSRVLEVGTGCGYQTAVLASLRPLVRRVFTIERLKDLIRRAEERLHAMGSRSVRFRYGDGYEGWPEEAPFDGILVTAAPEQVPQALLDQLAVGGRMVVPVGGDGVQELQIYDRTESGYQVDTVEYVRFVPLLKGRR